jgi:hypothetical protein
MRRTRRHSAPPTCRSCGHRVRFVRDAMDGNRWRILNSTPLPSHSVGPGALVIWNGRAWEPLDLEAELASLPRRPIDDDPRDHVLALDHYTQHACAVYAHIAARSDA